MDPKSLHDPSPSFSLSASPWASSLLIQHNQQYGLSFTIQSIKTPFTFKVLLCSVLCQVASCSCSDLDLCITSKRITLWLMKYVRYPFIPLRDHVIFLCGRFTQLYLINLLSQTLKRFAKLSKTMPFSHFLYSKVQVSFNVILIYNGFINDILNEYLKHLW